MNILVSLDTNYIWPLIIMLHSLLRSNPSTAFNVFILHSHMDKEDIDFVRKWIGTAQCEFIEVKVPASFSNAVVSSYRYPREMYYRIFAAQLLPKNISRILYLDPDIVVINPIDKLYRIDFQEKLIAASSHIHKRLQKINQIRLGLNEDASYINSGVLMMNLELWRERQDTAEVLRYIRENRLKLFLPDQDVINAVYGDSILYLDPLYYNLSERYLTFNNINLKNPKITLDWIRKNTSIIHYCGKNKPWNAHYKGKLDVFYRDTAADILKNGPD